MFDILDSMIATVTVVLVLSLIVQALQQIVKQLFNMKAKYMERELFAMFARVEYKPSMMPVKMQYERLARIHSEVKELVQNISRRLSSIGYNDLAMVEGMKKDEFLKMAGDLFDTSELETADTTKLSAEEKDELTRRINFLQQARLDVERWYDATVRAFQDHYERRMKMWAFILSGLVVLWLNANLFEIHREFSTNKVLRELAVRVGERLTTTPRDSLIVVTSPEGQAVQHVADSASLTVIQANIRRIDSLVYGQSFSIMRWNTPSGTPLPTSIATLWDAIRRNFFGWIGMTLLVGLGAPFWYDILRTLVGVKERLRGSGRSESRSESTPDEAQRAAPTPAVGPVQTLPPAVG
jgi:hypothetical protein